MVQEKIATLNDEHIAWLGSLDFYKQELEILKERLTEIAAKNTGQEAAKDIEHFENQFKIQINNIDQLHHDINANLANVAKEAKRNKAGYIDSELVRVHGKQSAEFNSLEKVINGVRQDFNRFAATWM